MSELFRRREAKARETKKTRAVEDFRELVTPTCSLNMEISDFLIMGTDGTEIEGHSYGSFLAFACPQCAHPILASAATKEAGSDETHPSKCRGCAKLFFLDPRLQSKKLSIHEVDKMGRILPL